MKLLVLSNLKHIKSIVGEILAKKEKGESILLCIVWNKQTIGFCQKDKFENCRLLHYIHVVVIWQSQVFISLKLKSHFSP